MNDEIKCDISSEVKNTAKILQEILIIIMGIAFTLTIIMFTTESTNIPKTFLQFTTLSVFAFICAITAIARFSHGNMSYLVRTYNISDYEAIIRKSNLRLAIDFIFIFIQGVIFCGLSMYQSFAFEFYSLFVILFFVDALWFFIIILFSRITYKDFEAHIAQENMRALMNWMVINFISGILILYVLFAGGPSIELSDKVPMFFIIIMGNTVLDYSLNRKLYFPSGIKSSEKTISFVAARFTTALKTGSFDPYLKEKILAIHEVIQGYGIVLYSSHNTEDFGNNLLKPNKFVYNDIKEISQCDIFVALLDEEFSSGVFIELGWASFLGKKILLFIPENYKLEESPMIRGLHTLTGFCQTISYKDVSNLKDLLRSQLQSIIPNL